MSEKVVQLNVVPVRGAPNLEVISRLEDFLERARSGDLTSVCLVGLLVNGSMYSGFEVHPGDSTFAVLGCIEAAKRDFMNVLIEAR